jgi:hypothetical protein
MKSMLDCGRWIVAKSGFVLIAFMQRSISSLITGCCIDVSCLDVGEGLLSGLKRYLNGGYRLIGISRLIVNQEDASSSLVIHP